MLVALAKAIMVISGCQGDRGKICPQTGDFMPVFGAPSSRRISTSINKGRTLRRGQSDREEVITRGNGHPRTQQLHYGA